MIGVWRQYGILPRILAFFYYLWDCKVVEEFIATTGSQRNRGKPVDPETVLGSFVAMLYPHDLLLDFAAEADNWIVFHAGMSGNVHRGQRNLELMIACSRQTAQLDRSCDATTLVLLGVLKDKRVEEHYEDIVGVRTMNY